jgi:ketosteroid isomerase-like protein
MSGTGETLLRAYMEATNSDDEARTLEVISEDFEMIEAATLPGAAHLRGRDELRRYWRGWQRNWSEWRWTPVLIEEDGERVLVQADLWLRATHTGIAVEKRWWYVFTVRDGRLVCQHGFDSDDEAGARAAFRA